MRSDQIILKNSRLLLHDLLFQSGHKGCPVYCPLIFLMLLHIESSLLGGAGGLGK